MPWYLYSHALEIKLPGVEIKLEITSDNLYNFLASLVSDQPALEFLMNGLYKIGVFKGLTKITDFVIDNYKQDIYDKVLKQYTPAPEEAKGDQ